MAAVFIFQACRIGALILFSVNPLSLFDAVGLLSCSAVHPGFQEVPSRHVLHREDLDAGYFHCSTTTLLSIPSNVSHNNCWSRIDAPCMFCLAWLKDHFTMEPVKVFHPIPVRAFPFHIMRPGRDVTTVW